MKFLKSLCVTSLVVMSFPMTIAWAQATAEEAKSTQSTDLPSVEQVIDNYFKAVGGKKVYTDTKTIVVDGELSIPAQGLSGEFKIHQKAPNKMLFVMNLEGIGEQRQGHDGETAWGISEMTGAEIYEGEQAAQLIMQADIAPFANITKKYDSVKVTGKEEFDGQDCYVLVAKTGDFEPITFYFSIESGLQIGMTMTQVSPMGKIEIVSKIGDYRDLDGLKMSYETTAELPNGISFATKINSAKRNVEIADSKFELPDEIKELK